VASAAVAAERRDSIPVPETQYGKNKVNTALLGSEAKLSHC